MCVNAKGIRTKERRLSYSRFHRPKPESVANYSDSLRYQMSDRIVFLSLCLNDQRTADRLALSVPISLGVGVEGGGYQPPLPSPTLSRRQSPSATDPPRSAEGFLARRVEGVGVGQVEMTRLTVAGTPRRLWEAAGRPSQ